MTQRATFAEIDLKAIAHNLNEIRKKASPAKIIAVVKTDAYGHGVKEIAELVVRQGVDYLGVALVEEGIELRNHGATIPILVFGGFFENQIELFLQHDLELTLFDENLVSALSRKALSKGKQAKVQIKVDTGMGRVGIDWREAVDFICKIKEFVNLKIVGIYTHFAASDARDKSYAHLQVRRFRKVLAQLDESGVNIPLKHAANSGAILDLPDSLLDMVRPGVSLYGYFPSQETTESIELKPAMSLKSHVLAVQKMEEESSISYSMTYKTDRKTKIAIVPIGYGDGYNRLFSNRGEVLIGGKRYPVVGRVCMDQIMIDVGAQSNIAVGDEVVLLGKQGNEEISIYEWCEKLDTIPYEITCAISKRVPRIYV